MSETQYGGPLDEVRRIHKTAARIDAIGQEYLERNPHDTDGIIQQLNGLNYTHPLAGQEVEVFGVNLTISVGGEDEPVPYALPDDRRPELTRGMYNGVTLRTMYDPAEDKYANKLVHMLYTGTGEMELDGYGNLHQTHFYNYVSIQGSEVIPVLPLDAHSLQDLEGDPVKTIIDSIIADQDIDEREVIMRIASEVNGALREQEFVTDGLNHQRASYINSLGLHDMVQLKVGEVLFGASKDHPASFSHRSLTETSNIIPDMFQIAPGYDKLAGVDEPLTGGPPELYARFDLTADRAIMLAALKDIGEVRLLPEI